jgi:2-dehydro-3-deoxyphosphogluconate aldolase/(4S)-4-hydroxy-2-oxoglutarate aldolase
MTPSTLSTPDALARLRAIRIVPVITIDDPDDAVPLARALHDGGLSCAEITFRTPRALEALRRITAEAPELFVGAGTVLTTTQAEAAADAGAQFIVAPGFNPRVVDYCLDRGMQVYPGVATPTELEAALEKGLTTLKFFPAEPMGGLAFLKAMAAPTSAWNFMPTGGSMCRNLASYLAFDHRSPAAHRGWRRPTGSRRNSSRIRDEARRASGIAHGRTPAVLA